MVTNSPNTNATRQWSGEVYPALHPLAYQPRDAKEAILPQTKCGDNIGLGETQPKPHLSLDTPHPFEILWGYNRQLNNIHNEKEE